MASVENPAQENQQARGIATVLAIGTANPPNVAYQADFPDFYFRVTGSEHMTQLKDKFKRICENSMIRKHHMNLTEDLIKENPNIGILNAPSFNARQEILVAEVPNLGKEAALKAIEEWGQPVSTITHNSSARVLIVCCEMMMLMCFHAPSDTYLDALVGSANFADGAAAVIVGANPNTKMERPLFQLVSAVQTIIPDSVHPGGPAILGAVEEKLGLQKEKLRASKQVLSEFGNMGSASVLFVLDEMRKNSIKQGKSTTGEGLQLGVLLAFGPGLTVETVVLRTIDN